MRIAAMTASEPVLQNATRSLPVSSQISSAHLAGQRRLRADLEAASSCARDGLGDEVGRVPEQDQAEAVHEVDVLVAVDVPELDPLARSATIG